MSVTADDDASHRGDADDVSGPVDLDQVHVAEATPELGRSATRGAAAMVVGQVVKLSLHFAGLIVLARLLDPEDYGLLAMVTAIVGLGEVVRDFGLSTAAVQAKTLSRSQRDALFWANTLIGLTLTLLVVVLAGPIASFYGEPELEGIARAIGITFLLNGLATQHRASLSRSLRFGRFTTADVGGHAIGLVTAVVLAAMGAGPWALVGQQLGQKGGVLVLSTVLAGWLPRIPKRGTELRPFMRFGRDLMGMHLVNYLSRNVDSLVIGRRFGAGPLGLYNRAFDLLMLPLSQMIAPSTTVALPILSRLREDKARFDAFLLRGQSAIMHAVMAVFSLTAAIASPLIPFVMGDQWTEVVEIFRILAVGGVFFAAAHATYWVFLSKGLTASGLRFQLVTRPVTIAVVVAAGFISPTAVAVAYAGTLVVTWPWQLWWIHRVSDAPVTDMARNGVRTMVAYGTAGLVTWGVTRSLGSWPDLAVIVVGVLVMAAAVAAMAAVWTSFRRDLFDMVKALQTVLPTSRLASLRRSGPAGQA